MATAASVHVRITRDGYTHRGRTYPKGSVLRVSQPTAKAILDYEIPAWGERITAEDAKASGAFVHDLTTLAPANNAPPPEAPAAKP